MSKLSWSRINRRALLVVTAVSFVGLMFSVATALVFVEAPANYSGFNQSYIYGFPLGWIIIEKISTPTGQVREIIHIAIAQFVADFAIWTTIVGIVVFVFERRIFGVNRNRTGDSKLTSRSEKTMRKPRIVTLLLILGIVLLVLAGLYWALDVGSCPPIPSGSYIPSVWPWGGICFQTFAGTSVYIMSTGITVIMLGGLLIVAALAVTRFWKKKPKKK